jgi:modulator of FtsH protease HflK
MANDDENKPNSPWGNGASGNENNDKPKPNNPNNNPWERPSNPWGGNGSQSQNLDDLAKRIEDKLKNALGGSSGGGFGGAPNLNEPASTKTYGFIALGALALWALSGVYLVDQGEKAIISRFGKFVRIADNGLNYRLPSPIETHTIVNVQRLNTITVGDINANADAQQNLMLTGDENIVNVGFQVFWRIKNPENFLFNVAHGQNNNGTAEETVNAVAEAAMREVVGQSQLEKILTSGRAQVEQSTKDLMQRTLDSYHSGIEVSQVNLRKSEPPANVVTSFREVAAASQEAETKVNQALSYRNSVVPQAQGEAARFNQIYQEYKLAPEVTRQRLYLETMEKVYERANKVIIDSKGGGQMMVLPPELLKPTPKADVPVANSQPNNGVK